MMKSSGILIMALVVISGCGLFETRQPESPQQGQSGFLPPTTSDVVIQNLTNAIEGKNVDNYLSCLSDTKFSFVPPPDVYSHYQSVFLMWDKSSEGAYFRNLVAQSANLATPALNLYSTNLTSPQGDSVQYTANYTLSWPNKLSNYPQQVEGYLQLTIGVDGSGNWSITRWIDSRLVSDSLTWSDMKARFSQ